MGDYEDIQNNNFSLNYKNLSVNRVTDNAFDLVRFQVERRGLTFKLEAVNNYIFVSDSKRILNVLLTLLLNAIKYTQEGSIEVKIS